MDQNTDLPLVPMKVICWHMQKTCEQIDKSNICKMEYIQNL